MGESASLGLELAVLDEGRERKIEREWEDGDVEADYDVVAQRPHS